MDPINPLNNFPILVQKDQQFKTLSDNGLIIFKVKME